MPALKPFIPRKDLPQGYDEIFKYYGLTANDYSIKDGKVTLSKQWYSEHIITVSIDEHFPGFPPYVDPTLKVERITLNRDILLPLGNVWKRLREKGLTQFLTSYAGCFNPRLSTGGKHLSTHTLGIAIDFNSRLNGYGLPPEKMEMRPEVVRVFEENGFCWGGRWEPTDGMHFQYTQPYPDSNWDIEPIHYDSVPESIVKQVPIDRIRYYNMDIGDVIKLLTSAYVADRSNGKSNFRVEDANVVVTIDGETLHIRKV